MSRIEICPLETFGVRFKLFGSGFRFGFCTAQGEYVFNTALPTYGLMDLWEMYIQCFMFHVFVKFSQKSNRLNCRSEYGIGVC